MAGYIISFNNIDSLNLAMQNGVYSTILNLPTNASWRISHEGTFADYLTMKEGDNIYFFNDRKIYGIGELVNINGDCKYLNFPKADLPIDYDYKTLREKMILNDSEENKKNRMLCTFKGSPYFFSHGVDMDEVLASNPGSFKMLRAFWKLSFIKIDHQENKALHDIILKTNEDSLQSSSNVISESVTLKDRINVLTDSSYNVKSEEILMSCNKGNGSLKHEMALEAGILDYISNQKTNVFGKWDYLSHQVIASPFKPIDYMDKMDIFGYRFIEGFQTISKYLVIENKKDEANPEVVHQLMKYVDWVNQEYSFGDYNMIEAFIVAKHFPQEVIDLKNEIGRRKYTKGTRPAKSMEWDNLRLITYNFDSDLKVLQFNEI